MKERKCDNAKTKLLKKNDDFDRMIRRDMKVLNLNIEKLENSNRDLELKIEKIKLK